MLRRSCGKLWVAEYLSLGAEQILGEDPQVVVGQFDGVLLVQADLVEGAPTENPSESVGTQRIDSPVRRLSGSNGAVRQTVRMRSVVAPPVMNVLAP